MAGIGYGYVERNADSYTNWYEVGKYATDMLDETARVRQEKKDALEQATRDSLKRIADTPIGAHASTRKAALEMANVASNSLLIQHKMMLSGKLDPKDYLIYNQNALDTIDLAFNANKAYQENWSKIMEGVKSGDMSGLTLSNAAKAEKYGDWNKMGWQMSPEGNLMVGLKEEQDINGQKVTTLGDLTSVTALNGLLLNTIPHNKLEEQTTNWVKSLGKNQLAVWKKAGFNQQGAVITEENITKRVDLTLDEKNIAFQFINAEKQQVTALLGDPTNIASILFDTKRTTNDGIAYEPTDSSEEAKKDPSKILRVYNQDTGGYNFVVSEKQRKEAEEYAFNRMREKYDVVEKIDVGTQLQDQSAQWKYDAGQAAKKEQEFAKNLAQNMVYSMTGDQAESNAATKYLSANTGALFNKLPNGYEITTKDGKQIYEFAPDGKLADPLGFSKSLVGVIKKNLPDEYKNVSEDTVLKYVKGFLPKGARLNQSTSARGFEPKAVKKTAVEQFASHIDDVMPKAFRKDATEDQILSSLNDKLAGTGFKAKTTIRGYVYVEDKDGNESPAFKVSDINVGLGRLSKWMKSNLPAKDIKGVKDKEAYAEELMKTGVFKSGGGSTQAKKTIQFDAQGNIIQ